MIGLYPIIRRVRRPLMPVDMEPPTAFAVPVKQVAPVTAPTEAPPVPPPAVAVPPAPPVAPAAIAPAVAAAPPVSASEASLFPEAETTASPGAPSSPEVKPPKRKANAKTPAN